MGVFGRELLSETVGQFLVIRNIMWADADKIERLLVGYVWNVGRWR